MAHERICASAGVINMAAKNSRLEINNECRVGGKKPWAALPGKKWLFCWNKSLPPALEAVPTPGSNLLWARWPWDGAVPEACWDQASPVLSTHTCGGAERDTGCWYISVFVRQENVFSKQEKYCNSSSVVTTVPTWKHICSCASMWGVPPPSAYPL